MTPHRAVTTLVVTLGVAGSAAPAAYAAPHVFAPPSASHGLLDSLPGPVSALPLPTLTTVLEQLTTGTPDPAALQAVVAQVSPQQITGLLGDPGAMSAILDGLGTTVTGLAGGGSAPSAAQVDAVVAQLTAILGGGIPTDPSQLADLQTVLAGLPALLTTPGLDQTGLDGLQGAVAGVLGTSQSGVPATPASVAGALGALFGFSKPPGSASATPVTTPTAAAPPASGAMTGAAARSTRFRAKVTRVKVARDARTVKATVLCAATAPACVSSIVVRAAGRKSKPTFVGLRAGERKTVRIRLTRRVAKRLVARGGKVTVSAATVGSSLGASKKAVHARKSARTKRA